MKPRLHRPDGSELDIGDLLQGHPSLCVHDQGIAVIVREIFQRVEKHRARNHRVGPPSTQLLNVGRIGIGVDRDGTKRSAHVTPSRILSDAKHPRGEEGFTLEGAEPAPNVDERLL